MAIQKEIIYKGTSLNYHIICYYTYNKMTNMTIINLHSYISKESRNETLENYIVINNYTLDGELDRQEQYIQLKNLPDWNDSIDI